MSELDGNIMPPSPEKDVTRTETPRTRVRPPKEGSPTVLLGKLSAEQNKGGRREGPPPRVWRHVLHGEEVARAHSWSALVVLLCLTTLAATPYLIDDTVSRFCFGAALILLSLTAIWVWFRSRDESTYDHRVFRTFGYTAALVSIVLEYYLGVFSPTPLVVTLGITFFGLGRDHKHALAICILAITGYLALAVLTTFEYVPDSPVIPSRDVSFSARLYFTIIGPLVMLVSLWMAQVSRRSMATAIERATEAMRLARRREAQLLEAQQELELALHAGTGYRGRFTGARAGRYELNDLIGRGGMGEIYAATDPVTELRAAVKVLSPDAIDEASNYERFVREGEITSRLISPNIVSIYDVGLMEGSLPYIAMELLEGRELAAHLRSKDRLTLTEITQIAANVARGLDDAHAAGVIHRDLKPQNIFYSKHSGTWKILDFGVSKLANEHRSLTGQGKVVGTPGYMAPEQATGAPVDHRTDVFALGSVIYRCLTGSQAFAGPDIPSILFRIVYNNPAPPSSLVDHLPKQMDAVMAVALAKAPNKRFQTASELAAAFERVVRNEADPEMMRRAAQLSLVFKA